MEQPKRTNVQRPRNVRRRTKKRRTPVKELAICAAIIFVAGFLLGFLVRGAFLPRTETPKETTPAPVQTTTEPKPQPPIPLTNWRLVLVNAANKLAEDYSVSVTKLPEGHEVDKRCYSDLRAMLDACKAAGLYPRLEAAYRTAEQQAEYFEAKIRELREQGMKSAEAEEKALRIAAQAGYSEHQLGLAVDIADEDARQWLMEHSWEYGFILRYPEGKTDQTGRDYDPGHYRYVGKEVAAEMWESGLCLEEYLAQFQ